jgi:hypothetical protein
MENREIDPNVVRKIRALLETNGCSEAEAQARMAKAHELLEKHNLDMAVLGQSGKGAQRSDTKKTGGLYSWQRKLWGSVAELNFCLYFSLKGLARGSVYEHRLVGSHANVIATEVMAKYLQETVEKLAQKWAKDNAYKSVFVREAIAYREGMAGRICERLEQRRAQQISELREQEAQRKRDEARDGIAPSTNALTIIDVTSTEADFNNDYLNGWEMGTTARNAAESKARYDAYMAKRRAEEAAKTPDQKAADAARIKAQMEQWAKEDAAREKRRNKTPPMPRYRRATPEEERANLSSYYEGRRDGQDVGLDQQTTHDSKRRLA